MPTLNALTQLQESSLVQAEPCGAEMRYRMLEMLREYAEQQLDVEERAAVSRRHAGYFSSLVEEADLGSVEREQQRLWTDRIESEHDNIRAALDWYGASGEIETGLGLAMKIQGFWSNRGYEREGLVRLLALLALPGSEGTAVRAWALSRAGAIANEQGDLARARALQEESLALARELGDAEQEARTLNNLCQPAPGAFSRRLRLDESKRTLNSVAGTDTRIGRR